MYELYRPIRLTFRGQERLPVGETAPLAVRFTHEDGAEVRVPGFWDGGEDYIVRFSPELIGHWSWQILDAGTPMDSTAGAFDVVQGEHPGPVRVAHRFHFAHPDGTPHRPLGATAYNWLHQEDELFRNTVDSIADAGFNRLRFMVFPQAGGYVEHEPARMPFARTDDGRWDVTQPDIEFFRHLDCAVEVLGDRGIQADVLIFNAYDRGVFGLDGLTEQEDEIYLRYLVARLAAHPHVWWSLCNEFDQLERPTERWDRAGEMLARVDPHSRLRSIHNWIELYDHNQPWVTHASIQNGSATTDFGRAGLYRDVYGKPIVLDEIKYEGDIPWRWGDLDAQQLVHQFWITTVSGCYASHGESFVTESGSLHMVEGGRLRGNAPARLAFLRSILEESTIPGFDPIDKWDDPAYVAGHAPDEYLLYLGRSAPSTWTFRLPVGFPGGKPQVGDHYRVDVIDTWNMTVTPLDEGFAITRVERADAYAEQAPPVVLAEGAALALRITRVETATMEEAR